MFKLTSTFLGLLAAAYLVSAGLFQSNTSEKVNDYLVRLLPDNRDWNQNLEAAIKWKNELINDPNADKAIIDGLTTLETLHNSLKVQQCNTTFYDAFKSSVEFVGSRCIDRDVDDNGLTRVQYLVRTVIESIKTCHKKRGDALETRLKLLDPNIIQQARFMQSLSLRSYLLNHRYNTCVHNTRKSDLKDVLETILDRMSGIQYKEYKYLKKVADEMGQRIVREDKVKETIIKHIMEPCNYMVKEVGDLLPLAQWESLIISTLDKSWNQRSDYPFKDYLPSYCVCNLFNQAGEEAVVNLALELVPKVRDYGRKYKGFKKLVNEHGGPFSLLLH